MLKLAGLGAHYPVPRLVPKLVWDHIFAQIGGWSLKHELKKNLIGLDMTLPKLISLEILGTDLKSVITAKFSP